MSKACIYALAAFVLSNGSICGCGNELEYIEGEQRYVNFVNKRLVSTPLDFSFFLSYNEKETRKKGAEDVSIREPEYRI